LTQLPITVITTHVHADHIGNHQEFNRIAVHEYETDWLKTGIPGLSHDTIMHNLMRDITKPLPADFDLNQFALYKGEADIILHDEEILDAGNRKIKILHTPGHSPGHISILDLKYQFLFTGDLLYIDTPIYAFYPTTDPKQLLNSLERIADIKGLNKIYGSHNTLGLNLSILQEAKSAIKYLREHHLDHFGTGVHQFDQLSIKF
jgi:glyoxylase-like metal-dependent hydrolase (beta-lactamase superfamily II)